MTQRLATPTIREVCAEFSVESRSSSTGAQATAARQPHGRSASALAGAGDVMQEPHSSGPSSFGWMSG